MASSASPCDETSTHSRETGRCAADARPDSQYESAVRRSWHVSSMTQRVPLHVVKNHSPQLQNRSASTRAVWWIASSVSGTYLTLEERAAPSELVPGALVTQRCVLCDRHFKQLSCAAVTAVQRTAPRSAARLSASCCATRVAQCERLLKETWAGARTWGSFHSVALAATRVPESDAPGFSAARCPWAVADSGIQHARSQPIVGCTPRAFRDRASPLQLIAHQTIGHSKRGEPRPATAVGAGKRFQRHRRSLALAFKTASRGAKLAS